MGKKIALVTGASSGFGRLTALALARSGLSVYASMCDIAGRNAAKAWDLVENGAAEGIDLHPLELDVQSEASVGAAVRAGSGLSLNMQCDLPRGFPFNVDQSLA